MKPQDRPDFESEWQKAFSDAEMMPSDQVWNNLELDLTRQANSKYQKRVSFLKYVAAASIFLALGVGAWAVYNLSVSDRDNLLTKEGPSLQNEVLGDKSTDEAARLEVDGSEAQHSERENTSITSKDNEQLLADKRQGLNDEERLEDQHTASLVQGSSVDETMALNSVNKNLKDPDLDRTDNESGVDKKRAGKAQKQPDGDDTNNSQSMDLADAGVVGDEYAEVLQNSNYAKGDDKGNSIQGQKEPQAIDQQAVETSMNAKATANEPVTLTDGNLPKETINQGEGTMAFTNAADNPELNNNGFSTTDNGLSSSEAITVNSSDVIDRDATVFDTRNARSNYLSAAIIEENPDKLDHLGLVLDDSGKLLEGEIHYLSWIGEVFTQTKKSHPLWVGVDLAFGQNNSASVESTGTFNALADASVSIDGLASAGSINISEEEPGGVLSAGLTLGKKLSSRWIVETGVSFIKRSTTTETNLIIENSDGGRSVIGTLNLEAGQLITTTNEQYELKNTYNSVALPIQAGYLLLDRRFGIALKTGLSNEFLLWNKITDTSGNLDDITISAGSDSQYNVFLLSGLLGTEFSYLLNDHYYFSVSPQLKQAFNSITKRQVSDSSKPMIFTVGFRINYLFK